MDEKIQAIYQTDDTTILFGLQKEQLMKRKNAFGLPMAHDRIFHAQYQAQVHWNFNGKTPPDHHKACKKCKPRQDFLIGKIEFAFNAIAKKGKKHHQRSGSQTKEKHV